MRAFQHWNCEHCKRYNDVLRMRCWSCNCIKPDWVTALHQLRIQFDRGIFDHYGVLANPFVFPYVREGRTAKILMTNNEEKHAKFFNEEAALVATMSDADLDEHIHELEEIAREAKARIMAATQNQRDRTAKQGNKKWRVEPLGPDPSVTDSLNKVKARSARMSKLDKMRDKMSVLGIPESEIDQMLAKMVAQARKEPEALRAEEKMKKDLGVKPNPEPSIVTEEERIRRIQARKALDEQDKLLDKLAEAEKKKEEEKLPTPFVIEKEKTTEVALEEPKEPKKPELPDWLKKIK